MIRPIRARNVLSQFGHGRAAIIAESGFALDLRSSLFSSAWRILVCSQDSAPFRIRLRQVPCSAARLSQDLLLISKAFREDLRKSL